MLLHFYSLVTKAPAGSVRVVQVKNALAAGFNVVQCLRNKGEHIGVEVQGLAGAITVAAHYRFCVAH